MDLELRGKRALITGGTGPLGRAAAAVLRGRKRAASIRQALVVPGSGLIRRQAEQEGLAQVFVDAGFEWREAGCSMCVALNEDRLAPGERCAATSNRNFEGRQGDRKSTRLNSSHSQQSRMPSSA